MLPPSLDYEMGKARQFELEQQLAKRRQVEEALAGKPLQQPGLRQRLLASMKNVAAKASARASATGRGQAATEEPAPKLGWR
jgi:hypothetical protein